MSTTRQNNALEKNYSWVKNLSLSRAHHHHHHCISQIILKEKGDEKLRTYSQQPKKKRYEKNQYCSVYTALRVFTLIEQNEANEEQQQQNKKSLMQVLAFVFVSAYRQKERIKKYIVVACFYSHNMTYAHREGEWERFIRLVCFKIFVVDHNLLRHTKNFQQFSFFVSLFHSLPILTTTSLSAVEMCGIIFFFSLSSFKIYRFFPSFFPTCSQ